MAEGHRAQHRVATMFGHDPARWQEFRRRYADEVRQNPEHLDKLRDRARQGPITLVFSAHDEAHNDAVLLRVRLKTSARITEFSQHEADGGKFQEREGAAVEIFPVLGKAAATVEPRNGAFDDPTLW